METEILRLFKFLESGSDEKQEFSVTAEQVFEYVKQYGLPESLYEIPPSRMDGIHLTEADGLYVVYYQERDFQDQVEKFSNKEDAIPEINRKKIEEGIKNIKEGKVRSFDSFVQLFKRKYQID